MQGSTELAGPRGVEPRSEVLETPILPLNYSPIERIISKR